VITKAGTVISGLNITGTVTVEAANVTIENCTITAATGGGVVTIGAGVTGAVVQNCTINGTGANNAGSTGIFGSGTFNGNNIYNVENGIAVTQGSTSTLIENNYIHNLLASGSPHYDGIQIDGGLSGVTIEHNTVINPFGQTSAIMLDNYFGALSNINVTNNLLEGGGYTIYDDGHFNSSAISGVSITNNHLGGGQWGNTDFNGTNPTYTGNVSDAATVVATLNTAANDAASTTSGAVPAPPTTTSSPPSATSSASVAPAVQTTTSTTSTHTPVDFTHLSENSSHVATLAGTADANSKVNVFDGAHEVGSVTTNASGAWTFSTGTLSGAVHTFTAQEVDSSGGVVAKSSGEAILASGSGSVLTGTSGNDYFTASGQNDTFVFANNFGQDVIKGFVPAGTGHDTIQLSATEFSNFASVLSHATQVGQDVVIHSGSDSLTLKDVKIGALSAHDFHFA
jgi:hypothetical protein